MKRLVAMMLAVTFLLTGCGGFHPKQENNTPKSTTKDKRKKKSRKWIVEVSKESIEVSKTLEDFQFHQKGNIELVSNALNNFEQTLTKTKQISPKNKDEEKLLSAYSHLQVGVQSMLDGSKEEITTYSDIFWSSKAEEIKALNKIAKQSTNDVLVSKSTTDTMSNLDNVLTPYITLTQKWNDLTTVLQLQAVNQAYEMFKREENNYGFAKTNKMKEKLRQHDQNGLDLIHTLQKINYFHHVYNPNNDINKSREFITFASDEYQRFIELDQKYIKESNKLDKQLQS